MLRESSSRETIQADFRRILKKHDKRTALTASAGFPSLVRSTSSAHVDKDGNISTWAFYNTSLPHVLLASLTDTLLPYVVTSPG